MAGKAIEELIAELEDGCWRARRQLEETREKYEESAKARSLTMGPNRSLLEGAEAHLARLSHALEEAQRAKNEPIRILGVDAPNVGHPRSDGTPSGRLYRVPIKLSRLPSRAWADAFPEVWSDPPQPSTKHRADLARVQDDCIVLDGTTLEEVRDYHAQTLSLVVRELNSVEAQHLAKEEQFRATEAARKNGSSSSAVHTRVMCAAWSTTSRLSRTGTMSLQPLVDGTRPREPMRESPCSSAAERSR